jgi:hypothetical protein
VSIKSKRIEGEIIGFTRLEGSKLSRFRNKAGVGFPAFLHKLTFKICKKVHLQMIEIVV